MFRFKGKTDDKKSITEEPVLEWLLNDYMISTDKNLISAPAVYEFLSRSFRSASRPYSEIVKSIENSICYGLYHLGRQIGFARVVSDLSTIYMLSDVFILEEYRGRGLGKWLIECVTSTPDLQNLIGFLATRNAQGLYRKYGFRNLDNPKIMMLKLP